MKVEITARWERPAPQPARGPASSGESRSQLGLNRVGCHEHEDLDGEVGIDVVLKSSAIVRARPSRLHVRGGSV